MTFITVPLDDCLEEGIRWAERYLTERYPTLERLVIRYPPEQADVLGIDHNGKLLATITVCESRNAQ